jgi:acyl carrier protein
MSTIEQLRQILNQECGVPEHEVMEDTDLLEGLRVDSLDLLNASFRIEKDFSVKLPIQAWLSEHYGEQAPAENRFLIGYICRYIDERAKP